MQWSLFISFVAEFLFISTACDPESRIPNTFVVSQIEFSVDANDFDEAVFIAFLFECFS